MDTTTTGGPGVSSGLLSEPSMVRTIRANRTVKDDLEAAIGRGRARRSISVTDLLNPMQAYHQRKYPQIQPSPEKRQLMLTGTGFHEVFGAAVSSEEYLEQYVEREGIVGIIDIFEDEVTELKTSGRLPEDLALERPYYIDQLGMYCAMAGKTDGVVVVYRRPEFGRPDGLRAYRVQFGDLDRIIQNMVKRRDDLKQALDREDPSGLPCCDWYKRGCDYGEVCACANASPSTDRIVDLTTISVQEDESLAQRLLDAAASRPRVRRLTLNDLVFPRRALGDASLSQRYDEPDLGDMQRFGFRRALTSALQHGEPGAYLGLPVRVGDVRGVVRTHNGTPCIIRDTGSVQMIERDRLPYERPFYIDRLALECAVLGQESGRLILYYKNIPDDKFMVYDIGFGDLSPTLEEAERRAQLLSAGAVPTDFPPCQPDWMSQYCPLKNGCHCR